jgi:hypothetical protein
VDGRDKHGHDDEEASSTTLLQPDLLNRTAVRFRGNDDEETAYDGWKITLTFVALNTYVSRQLDHATL